MMQVFQAWIISTVVLQHSLLVPGAAQTEQTDIRTQLQEVRKLVDEPKSPKCDDETLKKLLGKLNNVLKKDPKSGDAYYLRAVVEDKLNDQKAEMADLQQAINLDPKHSKAYWMLGIQAFGAGNYPEAMKNFDKAIELGEKSGSIYMNRGTVYQRLGKHDDAIKEFGKALNISPDLWPAHFMRSNSYLETGNVEAAIKDSDAVLSNKHIPVTAAGQAHRVRGVALQKQGKFEESIPELTQAAVTLIGKERGQMFYLRSYANHKLGKEEDSRSDLELARSLGFPSGQAIDKPIHTEGRENNTNIEEAIKPLIARARESLPQVKQRFLNGLPNGCILEITTKIFDNPNRFEQVFVRVSAWQGDEITGTLNNDVKLATHKRGETLTLKEADILDWTISSPDGTEEGNLIGKFLDNYKP